MFWVRCLWEALRVFAWMIVTATISCFQAVSKVTFDCFTLKKSQIFCELTRLFFFFFIKQAFRLAKAAWEYF